MRLERVEELCLEFLRHTLNPLAPVALLYEKCVADPQVGDTLTQEALLQFLRDHADVMVVDGLKEDDPMLCLAVASQAIETGPRAILKTRIPTRTEMADIMRQQIDDMRQQLRAALEKATRHNDLQTIAEIKELLARTDMLEEYVEKL